MPKSILPRRSFLKSAGAIGAMAAGSLSGANVAIAGGFSTSQNPANDPADTKYPKLSMIVPYSPQTLRFAASVGYEGIVIPINGNTSDLDNLTDSQIDKIAATARDVGIKVISLDCMFGFNHIAKDAGERKLARSRFLRSLEVAHRLGCKFVGTFSGGTNGASADAQVPKNTRRSSTRATCQPVRSWI